MENSMARPNKFIKILSENEKQVIIQEIKIMISKAVWVDDVLKKRYGEGHEVSRRAATIPGILKKMGIKLYEIW